MIPVSYVFELLCKEMRAGQEGAGRVRGPAWMALEPPAPRRGQLTRNPCGCVRCKVSSGYLANRIKGSETGHCI